MVVRGRLLRTSRLSAPKELGVRFDPSIFRSNTEALYHRATVPCRDFLFKLSGSTFFNKTNTTSKYFWKWPQIYFILHLFGLKIKLFIIFRQGRKLAELNRIILCLVAVFSVCCIFWPAKWGLHNALAGLNIVCCCFHEGFYLGIFGTSLK